MKLSLIVPLILCLFVLVSCNTKEEETKAPREIFSPRVPGGTRLDNPIVYDVIGLKADVTVDSVTLNWNVPTMYLSKNYKAHVYRIDGDGTNFVLPNPARAEEGAYLYYPRSNFEPFKGKTYVDANDGDLLGNLAEGATYTYIVVLEKDGNYSAGKRITVTIPTSEEAFITPSNTTFWKDYITRDGGAPDPNYHTINLSTLSPGAPTKEYANGGMAFARNGMVAFRVDTQFHRVMIYANTAGLSCYESHAEGTFDFELCITLYGNAPLMPYAVLGQSNFEDHFSCQDSANPLSQAECLTYPTQVKVAKNKLIIADSGNNRVVLFDTLPLYGCYNILNMMGNETPKQCSPHRVIGQRKVDLIETHSLASNGDASLSCPNGIEVVNDNIYIADTCNHRVVMARNALNPGFWNCNEMSWRTSSCVFGGLIGQENYFSAKTFKEEFLLGNVGYDQALNTITGDTNFLKRHIAYPKILKFSEDGKMLVAGEEDFKTPSAFGDIELQGRVLRFNSLVLEGTFPSCTESTFLTGGCDANWVYGQNGFLSIATTPIGGVYSDNYNSIRRIGGMELIGNRLFITDAVSNIVHFHENYLNNTVAGSPPNVKIFNPQGSWDADNNRAQPNLEALSSIVYNNKNKSIYIMDSGNWIYQLRIMKIF